MTTHGRLVYVLNARRGGSIQGYVAWRGAWCRFRGGTVGSGSTRRRRPSAPTRPGRLAFSPGGHQLIVTTKANGNAVDVFAIDRLGGPSLLPATTVLADAVPFAVAIDAHGKLALAEAGPNAVATSTLDGRGALSKIAEAPTAQAATCWIVNVGGQLYLSNAGSMSAFDGALAPIGMTPTGAGTVDAAASADEVVPRCPDRRRRRRGRLQRGAGRHALRAAVGRAEGRGRRRYRRPREMCRRCDANSSWTQQLR